MGLFSFFKKDQPGISAYMWEDEHCQVEIIPASNYSFVKKQAIKVNDFAAKHFNGVGFTAMYQAESIPFPTLQFSILIEDFEAILAKNSFIRIKKIQYENDGLINYDKGLTRAYGDSNFSIWAEVEKRIITNIWVTSRGANAEDTITKIINILNTMGEEYQLILADWNACEIVNLVDINAVSAYLREHY